MFAGLVFVIAACARTTYQVPPSLTEFADTQVTLTSGAVVGGISDNGAKTWLGIPYAQPPVGDLRWHPPLAVEPWSNIRPALAHGNWCPQRTNGWDGLLGLPRGELRGHEDCLFLDVYAPSRAVRGDNLPVMFWVHGGSNVWGRAEQYNGSELAQSQGIIVIVVQYRLGPLGWFAHPEFEQTGANFALMDLVQALRWTQSNISVFGGDPNAVTIAGESAGANNILALLSMPAADGLYRAVIAQSGLPTSIPLAIGRNGYGDTIQGATVAAATFTGQDEPSADELRQADLSTVFDAYRDARVPAVIRDGVTLPDMPLADVIASHQAGRGIPIVLGSNRDEAKYILAFDPAMTKKAIGIFPQPKDTAYYLATSDYITRAWRIIGVTGLAHKLNEAGAGPVRTYRFDWDNQGSVGPTNLSTMIGAAHSMEIPFVFGQFENFMGRLDKRFFTSKNEPGRLALSHLMMACWGHIIHREQVSTACPNWPAVQAEGQQTLVFDVPEEESLQLTDDTESFETIFADMAEDPVLDRKDRRCAVVQRLKGAFVIVAPEQMSNLESLCSENL